MSWKSRSCPGCGSDMNELPGSGSYPPDLNEWGCPECGYEIHVDVRRGTSDHTHHPP